MAIEACWTAPEGADDVPGPAGPDAQALVSLVGKAQQGCRRAFAALWRQHAPIVHTILLTMVQEAEADDLAQEVAMAAFRALRGLHRRESFPAWLCAIARNTGRDALARQRRSLEVALDAVPAETLVAPPRGDQVTADEILAEIRHLPACYREPLLLRLLLDLTGPEIAERTGMTQGSVRVNLCRGMKLLRQRLQENDAAADGAP